MTRRSLATSINVHGFIAETTDQAADDFYGPQAEVMNRIGRERGWGPTSRAHFDQSRGPNGALFVGNPEQVAEKIVAQHRIFGNDRFLLQMAIGIMPHAKIMKAIELYGTRVAPIVRKETAKALLPWQRPSSERRAARPRSLAVARYGLPAAAPIISA